jgi:Zinc-finger of C2H2 type
MRDGGVEKQEEEGEEDEEKKKEEEEVVPFTCSICDISFQDASQRDIHMSAGVLPVTSDGQLSCSLCGRRFRDSRGLHQHSLACRMAA